MTNALNEDTCPFCRRPMGRTLKKLYGHEICTKCYYAFANRRQLAFVIDRIAWILPPAALSYLAIFLVSLSGNAVTAGTVNAINLMTWPLYFIFLFKDGFRGYSLGKYLCGVQTIDPRTREPISFAASFKRNLPIYIPFVPLFIAYQLQRGKRLGDGWAHSMVIWKKYERSHVFGSVGSCEVCQYDLRGNISGICPECGTPLSAINLQLYPPAATQPVPPNATTPPPLPPLS